ncbi:MAG: protein kinase family protein [Kofleriaceae bacterium]
MGPDVYAIGTVLYELLAGTPPHHDETPQATLDRVIAGPPRPLSCMVAHVPSELATIVAKAMARCPDDRYPNASSLAEDLRRFQCGKLVSAHSYTAWSLLRKKVAQHRGVFAVAVASALALGAVGVESFRRVVAERNIAEVARANADTASAQLRKRQRELVLLQAETALRKDPTATLAWLKEYAIGDEDRAHVLDVIDEALAEGVSRHVFRPGDWVHDAAFTSDDRMVVAASRDGVLRAFDLDTGIETALGSNPSSLEQLAMSPDGRFVVTAGALGEVAVWPLPGASGVQARVLSRAGRPVSELRFSRDGRRVLVTRERGPAEVLPLDGGPPSSLGAQAAFGPSVALDDWTRQVYVTAPNQVVVDDGDATRALARTDKAISRVAISPSGDTVLVYDGSTVWSVPFAGGAMRRLASYEGKMNSPVWSPDQRTVALTGGMHDILLVEVASGTSRELRGHTDALYSVQWTRDGHRLLSASDDGTSRVWTVSDGTSIVLRGHDDDVYQARFSSDERQVVSSSLDGSIRVWQVEQPGSRRLVEGSPIDSMSVVADRALVKTATEVAWWNLSSGHRVPVFSWAQEPRSLGIASPSPDGEHLLVPGADWSIEVRSRKREPVMLRGHRSVISRVEFSRDSHSLYTSSFDGTLRKWNLETGASTLLLDGTAPVRNFALGEDGRVVAQLGEPGNELSKLIAPDGTVSDLGERGDPRWCISFAEFDRVRDRMLLRRCDRTSAMLDGDRLVELPTDHYGVVRFAASPDGSRIAGALGDRTIRVWDATTGRVLETLRGHSDLVWDVAFSPDGQRIASASYDRTVRVWQSGRQRHRVLRGHAASVNHIAWKDGAHLVTGSRDGTLRVWDVPSVDLPTPGELATLLRRATSARIDGDRPTSCDARRIGT